MMDLKPCPFCGEQSNDDFKPSLRVTNAIDGFMIGASVYCPLCGIDMSDEYLSAVVERWNTRGRVCYS